MASKHDVLTEDEMKFFNVNSVLIDEINKFLLSHPNLKKEDVNILDWGCGRGRSVAKLREMGFNAFGIEIDEKTLSNGFLFFKNRGLNPKDLLKSSKELDDFKSNYFHIIFSEQVFEHISNISEVIQIFNRLTVKDGIGIHFFPGSKNKNEGHIFMPYIHWLPKNFLRKIYISFMLLLGKGPEKNKWIETHGKSFFQVVDIYYKYMNNKTFYRDNYDIQKIFLQNGFTAEFYLSGNNKRHKKLYKFVPKRFFDNGFPNGSVIFRVRKKENIGYE